ncbi:MAG TPA: YbhB/YbcL family Raf kinase inhibitor-like protein [Anaerolineae bacterium]|mgnify:CR=1 FL=1|nr:YbhB/YbcL family Raf kinase inhibitor-like protein [Anaerolineae bacterium]HQK13706.1 YbhB/YbcL family Raf kinase inhibitor-like protein [Anaerolineae bacterium]
MKTRVLVALVGCVTLVSLLGCQRGETPVSSPPAPTAPVATEATAAFLLTSSAFARGEAIPAAYTCDGLDKSPPLSWTEPPAGTQSFALIVTDPDAPTGTWVHWVAYNIPAEVRSLSEGVVDDAGLSGGVHGKNSWGRSNYGGPCPPSGTHRYFFKLYALDTLLSVEGDATQRRLLAAMQGHILAETELMGTYKHP